MKIAIIGAGTFGLYLAWKLAEKGEEVVLFEKRSGIGTEVCSGLFSERVLNFVPQSRKLIQNEIDLAYIYFPKKTIRLRFSKKFYVMSHFEFDKILGDLAKNSGAKLLFNQNLESLPEGFDRIIGCDGAFSFTRKKLQLPDPNFRSGIQGFVTKDAKDNFVESWPVKNGFIWKIPRGYEIEYGIMADPKDASKLFDEFINKNKISLQYTKAKIIPQGFIIPNNPKVTLCGNAAGLTKPWSGGGVAWGLVACNILLKTLPDFLAYRKKMKNFFVPRIKLSHLAIKSAYFFGHKLPWLVPGRFYIESDFLL